MVTESVNAILAHDAEYGIGKNNGLPWPRNDADMKWFYDLTKNSVVVMGTETWKSLGAKSLPKRENVVLTTSLLKDIPLNDGGEGVKYHINEKGVVLASAIHMPNLIAFLRKRFPGKKIFFIGGANVYLQAIAYCDSVYVTRFPGTYDCDTYLPEPFVKHLKNSFAWTVGKKADDLSFVIYKRF